MNVGVTRHGQPMALGGNGLDEVVAARHQLRQPFALRIANSIGLEFKRLDCTLYLFRCFADTVNYQAPIFRLAGALF